MRRVGTKTDQTESHLDFFFFLNGKRQLLYVSVNNLSNLSSNRLILLYNMFKVYDTEQNAANIFNETRQN